MKVLANIRTVTLSSFLFLLVLNQAHAGGVTVAAANSTCMVLKDIGALYERENDIVVNYMCKSSGHLAKGLKGGAIKADVYISASKEWMDKMVERAVVDESTVVSLWGNSLVAVASKDDPITIDRWSELATDKVKAIIIGDPGTAPFGRYAKQAFQTTGIWSSIKSKVATRKNTGLLADAVASSVNGTIGILFSTNVNNKMKVVYALDKAWHKPVKYYGSVVSDADNPSEANSFIRFMNGDSSRKVLVDAGFDFSEF